MQTMQIKKYLIPCKLSPTQNLIECGYLRESVRPMHKHPCSQAHLLAHKQIPVKK